MRDIQLCEFGNASMVAAYMAVRRKSRIKLALIVAFFIGLLALSGCAGYAVPYTTPPGDTACVQVIWTDAADIQAYCPSGAAACATVGPRYQMQTIWTTKPAAFDDDFNVLKLGHEFLHSLGARHQ